MAQDCNLNIESLTICGLRGGQAEWLLWVIKGGHWQRENKISRQPNNISIGRLSINLAEPDLRFAGRATETGYPLDMFIWQMVNLHISSVYSAFLSIHIMSINELCTNKKKTLSTNLLLQGINLSRLKRRFRTICIVEIWVANLITFDGMCWFVRRIASQCHQLTITVDDMNAVYPKWNPITKTSYKYTNKALQKLRRRDGPKSDNNISR